MENKDLNISEMIKMQKELHEINKERWGEYYPEDAKNHLLYMVEEMGECISIIKKKGIDTIMQEGHVRERFVEEISDVLCTLTEREEQVLRLRFGLDDGSCKTLEEVGQMFGVTRERIRQIEAKALRKLRHPSRSKKLRDYLD